MMDGEMEWAGAKADLPETGKRRPWLGLMLGLLFAFGGGLAAAVYTLTNWERAAALVKLEKRDARPAPLPVAKAPAPAVESPKVGLRLSQVEQRIADLDARASAASGNAERAEGLLVAFAARRALDRGVALGYIEGLLRERFGGTDPQAVAAVISAARQPVTLGELQSGFEKISPSLGSAPGEDWWDGLKRGLSGLIVVRRADTPPSAPVDRLARAGRQLETGQVDLALAEVARLPGREAAGDWIVKARRYVTARRSLDRIETAALLRPHAPVRPAIEEEPVFAPVEALAEEPVNESVDEPVL
jgi:hypothetical protein